mmetsp:Transcript_32354/g.76011  ORF Transcript_32354/g.76011 Transcript_32354/m.76011 type:complete len:150 (+) Transcript_32354:108-557(+)
MGCNSSVPVAHEAPMKAYMMKEVQKQNRAGAATPKGFISEASTSTPFFSGKTSAQQVPMHQVVTEDDIVRSTDNPGASSFQSLRCVWDIQDYSWGHPLVPDNETHTLHLANLEKFLQEVSQCPGDLEARCWIRAVSGCTEDEVPSFITL